MLYPGDFIGTEEECTPGTGVVDEQGNVYASLAGKLARNGLEASVQATKAKRPIQKGDVVYGVIQNLFDQIALIEIQPVNANACVHDKFAFLRISKVQQGYTESFRGFLAIGDYVRAKIIEVTPLGTYLTIAFPELGVVKAFCSRCRKKLSDDLACGDCRHRESRKTAVKMRSA